MNEMALFIYFQVHADSLKYTTHLTELGKLWVKLYVI